MIENLERIIISELVQANKQERVDAIIELQKVDFGNYQSLFKTIVELTLSDREVDSVTLYQTNQEYKVKEIIEILDTTHSSAYLTQHIYLLKSKQFKEQIVKKIETNLTQIKGGDFGEDIEEIKNSLIVDLSSITMDDKIDFDRFSDSKAKIKEHLNSDLKIEGYSWGITDLDKWTSGIVIPRVYVIGGLKKSGKTRFLIQTLRYLHDQKVPTVFQSLEMPAYEATKLMLSAMTGFNDLKFRAGSNLTKEEKWIMDKTEIDEKILSMECKSGLSLEQVLIRLRRYSKMGFKVVAIDYIQRITHDRNKQAQELENIAIRLADAARQYNLSLIILSQLNALGEKEVPNMGHLKGSGGIGESADTILLLDNLYRRTKKEEDKGQIHLYIEQRYGDSGLLKLQSDLGACQFRNLTEAVYVENTSEIF